jgi:hypothetical protein
MAGPWGAHWRGRGGEREGERSRGGTARVQLWCHGEREGCRRGRHGEGLLGESLVRAALGVLLLLTWGRKEREEREKEKRERENDRKT